MGCHLPFVSDDIMLTRLCNLDPIQTLLLYCITGDYSISIMYRPFMFLAKIKKVPHVFIWKLSFVQIYFIVNIAVLVNCKGVLKHNVTFCTRGCLIQRFLLVVEVENTDFIASLCLNTLREQFRNHNLDCKACLLAHLSQRLTR